VIRECKHDTYLRFSTVAVVAISTFCACAIPVEPLGPVVILDIGMFGWVQGRR
jgi:hypothetical protein